MNVFKIPNKDGKIIRGFANRGWPGKPVFIFVHGFRGKMSQKFIAEGAELLNKRGFSIVCFDATDHIGESDGSLFDFTFSGFVEDINLVIDYTLNSDFGNNGVGIVGHSLGGLASLFVDYSKEINYSAFICSPLRFRSTGILQHRDVISYEEGKSIHFVHKVESQGNIETTPYDISWNMQEDLQNYSQLMVEERLRNLESYKLFLYGENDNIVGKLPSEYAYNISSEPKKLLMIPIADHNIHNDFSIKYVIGKIEDLGLNLPNRN